MLHCQLYGVINQYKLFFLLIKANIDCWVQWLLYLTNKRIRKTRAIFESFCKVLKNFIPREIQWQHHLQRFHVITSSKKRNFFWVDGFLPSANFVRTRTKWLAMNTYYHPKVYELWSFDRAKQDLGTAPDFLERI